MAEREGLIGWRWVTPKHPEGDDVFAICQVCGDVMTVGRPGILICDCGAHMELGE